MSERHLWNLNSLLHLVRRGYFSLLLTWTLSTNRVWSTSSVLRATRTVTETLTSSRICGCGCGCFCFCFLLLLLLLLLFLRLLVRLLHVLGVLLGHGSVAQDTIHNVEMKKHGTMTPFLFCVAT